VVWSVETSKGFESAKIAAAAIHYLQGRVLDLGCGMAPVWPNVIGIDNGSAFGENTQGIRGDITDLSLFQDGTMDAVFSSHALEDIERERVPAVLAEWARVLKVGGYLVLYVPSANLYPRIGEEGANTAHQWDIFPGEIDKILRGMTGLGWELIESEEREERDEYSLFIVARKTEAGWSENLWQRNPDGKKRAIIVRYGAIGDQIIASSILPALKAQGYHVTYNTTPSGQDILRHDPHIDEWVIQATGYVPNEQLGPYWHALSQRYDLFINLCESIEGSLLALPTRREDMMPPLVRRKVMGTVNYLERTHDLAGVPHDFAPKFYPTAEELASARALRDTMDGYVVYWAINGSSPHKIYGYPQAVIAWLMERGDVHVVLCGDKIQSLPIQEGLLKRIRADGFDTSRLHGLCGQQTVRESLTFGLMADVVVGPETGILNAMAFENVWKVIYLSHSSHENLTKHWKRTLVLQPDPEMAPCYPCHRLHYDWSRCNQHAETKAALCASGVAPKLMLDVIGKVLARVEREKKIVAEAAD